MSDLVPRYARAVDEKNPFAPEVERVPFLLMLDALSFERLTGEERERAEFLCELCWTDAIDALWSGRERRSWATSPRQNFDL